MTEDRFKEMENSINLIKNCLLGNEFTEDQGLVKKVTANEAEIRNLRETFSRYKNILIGLSIGTGAGLGAVLGKIVDAFTKH